MQVWSVVSVKCAAGREGFIGWHEKRVIIIGEEALMLFWCVNCEERAMLRRVN